MMGSERAIPIAEAGGTALPEAPGVYLFVNDRDEPLYIGKAADLRARVRQYLAGHDARPLIPLLLREATAVRVIVVRDAREALVLEDRLIKEHRPRYNIDLKDDKSYPYLVFTREPFPLLAVVRRPRGRFRFVRGPLPAAKLLRRFRQALLAAYPLRRCRVMPRKACINHQMGLCPAPCEGRISAEEYERRVRQAIAVIEGRGWREFAATLRGEIARAANELRFEKAGELRDTVALLPELRRRFGIATRAEGTLDAFYLSRDGDTLLVTVGRYAEGMLLDLYHFRHAIEEETPTAAARAVASFYEFQPPPGKIALHPSSLVDPALVTALIDPAPRIAPMSAAMRSLLARNHAHQRERLLRDAENASDAIETLEAIVGTEVASILCLDISTLQGAHTRAGAVWWEAGRFVTGNYRRFTMKSVAGQNDPAALAETAARLRAHWDAGEWPVPDLLLVDGGIPQLNAVLPVVGDRVALLGIVKDRRGERGHEKLVASDGSGTPLGADPFAILLKRIRDEAHRFALTANRAARRRDISSLLGGVPGIGPAREKALITRFGTIAAVRSASADELAAIPGMTTRAAAALWDRLHGECRRHGREKG